MASRLPIPGHDDGQWGNILNDFLSQSLAADGTLRPAAVIAAGAGNYSKPGAGIPSTDLDVATQTAIATVASKYTKPPGGIPAADLDAAGQSALTKATSAVQRINSKLPDGNGVVTLTPGDIGAPTTIAQLSDVNAVGATTNQVLSYDQGTGKWSAATVSSTAINDASNTGKGIVQLAGDLGGSNDPTSPTIATGAVTGAKIANATITDTNISATAAIAQTKIQNLVTDLSAKAPLANPTFTGTVTVPSPANPTDATTKAYVDSAAAGGTPDADGSTKGKIQLAGDLAGTAAAPTVPALANKADTATVNTALAGKEPTITAGTTSQYWRGDKTFQTLDKTVVGLGSVDNTSDLGKPVSTAVQTALDAKAPLASPTFTGTVTVPTPSNATDASTKAYVDSTAAAGAAPHATVTVGLTGSGAMQICDGIADNVQIQAAVNAVTAAGGGIVRIFSGTYDIQATITVPKDPKIRIEGEYTTKSGYGGTALQVNGSLGSNLAAIIKESGTVPAVTSNADHSHGSQYDRLIFDGQSKADAGLLLINTDHTIVSNSKFVNVAIGIDGQYNGSVAASDYAGGLRVQGSSFLASSTNIRLDSHTQDWITDSWFLGVPSNCHIQFISSNKIHLSNNEFNTVGGSAFIFNDTVALQCGDINITGGFINAGAGKPFWVDTRTNGSSKGVIVSGVRMVTGTTTQLFQQSKAYQGVTYTSANLSGGFIIPDFNDQVILLNAAGAALPLQLPSAATAINNIWVKAINVANTVTIVPAGADQIEQAGVLGSVFTFAEVNESVLISPDGNKWRVLEDHKPSTLTATGAVPEAVVEVSSATYTLTTATDVLLVNAASNAVAVTLPAKATKYAATRKTFTIKVINATNAVTITAAGADEIDNVGQTSIVVSDTRAVVLHANSGSRWRTWSSAMPTRVGTVASGTTITPTGDASDLYTVTALAAAATIAAPSGTPANGQRLTLRIVDNGTPRALTWNAIYRPIGVTLPATTTASKLIYVQCMYNSAGAKWDVLTVSLEP